MKTYKIKAGAVRNTPLQNRFLEIENGIAGSIFLPIDDDAIIRVHYLNSLRRDFLVAEVPLSKILDEGMGGL